MVTAAADWDYFADGHRLYDESMVFRCRAHIVDHPSDELLIPARTFYYHDRGQELGHLSVDLVDYYRCWPCADPDDESVRTFAGQGCITRPLVIYCDGKRAVLGEGNHRLAAAKLTGQSLLPVLVVPDRLALDDGQTVKDADPEVLAAVDRISRRHHGGPGASYHRHQLSIYDHLGTTFVFCVCGAHWRRASH